MATKPFAKVVQTPTDMSALKFDEPGFGTRMLKKLRITTADRFELQNGQAAVNNARASLVGTTQAIENLGKQAQVPEALVKQLDIATAEFNRTSNQLGVAQKKILPSIKHAVREMGAKIGIDTGNIGARAMKGDTAEIAEQVAKTYKRTGAGMIERVASKPFRVAANNPGKALVVLGLAAVALVGSLFKGRAEKRTMENAQNEVNAAAGRAQANAYTVTPEEYAAMEARMRQSGAGHAGHADAVQAARAQAAAQAPIAQNV